MASDPVSTDDATLWRELRRLADDEKVWRELGQILTHKEPNERNVSVKAILQQRQKAVRRAKGRPFQNIFKADGPAVWRERSTLPAIRAFLARWVRGGGIAVL